MRQSRSHSYQDSLQPYVPGSVYQPDPERRGACVVLVTCKHCGPLEAFHAANRMPPDKLVRILRERGWFIGNSAAKHVCPVHQAHKPESKPKEQPMPANDPTPAPVLRAVPDAKPSHDARAAKREAMAMLEETFNVTKGQFAPGITDVTIADMTGLAEAAVAQLREEFFGPLQEPDGLREVRAELAQIYEDANGLKERTAVAMGKLENRLTTLQQTLNTMTVRNGWKT